MCPCREPESFLVVEWTLGHGTEYRIWVAGTDQLESAAFAQETPEALGPGDKAQHLCVSVTSTSKVPASLTDTIRRNLNDWLVWSEENSTDIM